MIRGTTPTHTFTITSGLDASVIRNLKITYSQRGKVVLEKTKADATLDGSAIKVRLTQEDTFKFDCTALVEIQIRVLTTDGTVSATDPMQVSVNRCLDDEVLK